MRRGDIVAVDLRPARGSRTDMSRLAVIVSNDAADSARADTITLVPLTSNIERIYPFQVLLDATVTGLPRDVKAQAEQVRSIAVDRIGQTRGHLPRAQIRKVDAALRAHLAV